MNVGEVNRWVETAKPGDKVIYWTGDLAMRSVFSDVPLKNFKLHLAGARHMGKLGSSELLRPLVDLTQRKIADRVYEYIATRRANNG